MNIRQLLLPAILAFSANSVYADSTENYRDAFIAHCSDDTAEQEERTLCACTYDRWQDSLASRTDKDAINLAKVMSNSTAELYPSEIMAASQHLNSIQQYSMECADIAYGKIKIGGEEDTASIPTQLPDMSDYPTDTTAEPSETGKKRGLLGAVTRWGAKKAGLGDEISDMAGDQVDNNEESIKGKFNPLKSKLNPFKKNKNKEPEAEAAEE